MVNVGFYDMEALATSFEEQYNAQPGIKLHGMQCMPTGDTEAECMGTVSNGNWLQPDGSKNSATVKISPDGTSWMTASR